MKNSKIFEFFISKNFNIHLKPHKSILWAWCFPIQFFLLCTIYLKWRDIVFKVVSSAERSYCIIRKKVFKWYNNFSCYTFTTYTQLYNPYFIEIVNSDLGDIILCTNIEISPSVHVKSSQIFKVLFISILKDFSGARIIKLILQ